MTLEELARAQPFARPLAAPAWTLGCFRRRCITYFNGEEDVTTQVLWLQSHGLTADIRIPARRPEVAAHGSLAHCPTKDQVRLAQADGFIAETAWNDGHMSWNVFAAFQPYTRWPEPGRLERVGTSLIEWAPSGAYVEDWRLQPGSDGLCVGLRLVSETGQDGVTHLREGGLVITGDHALQVLGRRQSLAHGRADDAIIEAGEGPVFDCSIVYGRGAAASFTVELSIDPFLVGGLFEGMDQFAPGEAADVLVQTAPPGAGWRERRWKVDTLLADQARPNATPASPEATAWLAAEWDVLRP